MDLKKCQIFTPHNIVVFMLDKIGYDKDIINKKIVDFSCGNGSFLVEIAERLINDAKVQGLSNEDVVHQLENNIFGYEIDQAVMDECVSNLNRLAKTCKLSQVKWNVQHGDGLDIRGKNEFDFVVGNPPYISYKNLTQTERNKVRANFRSCYKGKFDYSYAFIEKGIDLLKDSAKMVMISPSNMFKAVFGNALRQLILPHLVGVIDCSKNKIFDKVITSPAITIYEKNNKLSFINFQAGLYDLNTRIDKSALNNKWIFTSLKIGLRRFGDSFKASNSVATLLNDVYIHDVDNDGTLVIDGIKIEDDLLRVAKSPRSEYCKKRQKIIFPYKYDANGDIIKLSETELANNFPNAYTFLKKQRERLEKRDSDRSAHWFEFGRSQALAKLYQEKLMLSSIITDEVKVYSLSIDEIPYSGIYIISRDGSSLEEANLILKSRRFFNYIQSIGTPANGKSLRISSKDIENYTF